MRDHSRSALNAGEGARVPAITLMLAKLERDNWINLFNYFSKPNARKMLLTPLRDFLAKYQLRQDVSSGNALVSKYARALLSILGLIGLQGVLSHG